jgi:hypothetical protein
MVVQNKMLPIPENVKVLANWTDIEIVSDKKIVAVGDHMLLEAEPEAFKTWLKPFDGVWVGKGSPMLQEFDMMHIE